MRYNSNFQKKSITILIFFTFYFLPSINFLHAQANSIQVDLNVGGCNNNGICEVGENTMSCPVDCPVVIPTIPGGRNSGFPLLNINNLEVVPELNSATIFWSSTIGTISTIRWGETTEVGDGTLKSVVFALNHEMEIINLKPGTMYYFTIESLSNDGRTHITTPISFLTKSLKDTTYPLNPRNVRSYADIVGIFISWNNPPDPNFSYIRIMRHEDRFRGSPFLGKLIYEGVAEKFLDKNVIPGKRYFYSVFSRNNDGSFSSGVATTAVAYSKKIIPTTPEIIKPGDSVPPVTKPGTTTPTPMIFFVYQYNQQPETLISKKVINIDGDKDTIIDTNSKTSYNDFIWVENEKGELVSIFLFSYHKDSGRYQSVIPPLQKAGNYDVKIYRYKDGNSFIIGEGILKVTEKIVPQKVPCLRQFYGCLIIDILFLLLLLFLVFLYSKYIHKIQAKQGF
jgi:hypothetical protein